MARILITLLALAVILMALAELFPRRAWRARLWLARRLRPRRARRAATGDKAREIDYRVATGSPPPSVTVLSYEMADGRLVEAARLADCPDCGARISKTAALCPRCGRRMEAGVITIQKTAKWLKALVIVAVMVMLAGCGVMAASAAAGDMMLEVALTGLAIFVLGGLFYLGVRGLIWWHHG